MSGLDHETLKHALTTAREKGYRFVSVSCGEEKFRAVLSETDTESDEFLDDSPPKGDQDSIQEGTFEVSAPVVGYFREGKSPLETGRIFNSGDVLGEIVALGLANDVSTPKDGEVTKIHVNPGDAVEYGQVLVTMRSK